MGSVCPPAIRTIPSSRSLPAPLTSHLWLVLQRRGALPLLWPCHGHTYHHPNPKFQLGTEERGDRSCEEAPHGWTPDKRHPTPSFLLDHCSITQWQGRGLSRTDSSCPERRTTSAEPSTTQGPGGSRSRGKPHSCGSGRAPQGREAPQHRYTSHRISHSEAGFRKEALA